MAVRTVQIGAAIAILCALAMPALAHDSSTPFADWFTSRKQPDNPAASCCGLSDQYYVDEYHSSPTDPGGFVVIVGSQEIIVPPEKVDWESANPTGRGVIFLAAPEPFS